jgi:hypothetical protein
MVMLDDHQAVQKMTGIRVHAEKNCRKILHPGNNYSPTIQMWYNRIHAYLQFIRMTEGKKRNVLCFAQQQHINKPEELTMKELQDGLQFERIRKAELCKQAKGLRKVHLCDCLIKQWRRSRRHAQQQ